jgi:hypothetical protein
MGSRSFRQPAPGPRAWDQRPQRLAPKKWLPVMEEDLPNEPRVLQATQKVMVAASGLTKVPAAARTRQPWEWMREEAGAELPSAEEPPFRMSRSVPFRVSNGRLPRLQRNMETSRPCRQLRR